MGVRRKALDVVERSGRQDWGGGVPAFTPRRVESAALSRGPRSPR